MNASDTQNSLAAYREQLTRTLEQFNAPRSLVTLGDELVRLATPLEEEDQQTLLTVVVALLVSLHQGNTRLGVGSSLSQMAAMLTTWGHEHEAPSPLPADEWTARIERLFAQPAMTPLLGNAGDFRPLILDRNALYLHRMWRVESRCGQRLLSRLASARQMGEAVSRSEEQWHELVEAIATKPVLLTEAQRHAVRTAAASPFAVITGGPGTGKTTIVVALLRLLFRLGIDPTTIALAAPTGKAANRMSESMDRQQQVLDEPGLAAMPAPRTLHRLLGYSPRSGRFRHHENNPLPEEVVLVDEASMIDLVMMDHLLAALKPTARLVLIGDADQLPSVESGAVFRDLSTGEQNWDANHPLKGRVARLQGNKRAAEGKEGERSPQNVVKIARLINEEPLRSRQWWASKPSAATDETVLMRKSADELDFLGVEQVVLDSAADTAIPSGNSPARHYDQQFELFLDGWFARFLSPLPEHRLEDWVARVDRTGLVYEEDRDRVQRVFDRLQESRLLCVTRRRRGGVERTNRALHRRFAEAIGRSPLTEYLPGEPVMVLENDYLRQLYNGDQGIVVPITFERAERPPQDEERAVAEEELDAISPLAGSLSAASPLAGSPAAAGLSAASRPWSQLGVIFPRGSEMKAVTVRSLRGKMEHAYAMTVHKSQGSEFPHVGMILPDQMVPLLTREIVYTALTRSRRSVTLFGATKLLEEGTLQTMQRDCGIAERLLESG